MDLVSSPRALILLRRTQVRMGHIGRAIVAVTVGRRVLVRAYLSLEVSRWAVAVVRGRSRLVEAEAGGAVAAEARAWLLSGERRHSVILAEQVACIKERFLLTMLPR